jgi:hypothetical protein
MHTADKTARRYHWHSDNLESFVEEPHTGICGLNQGEILNLTDAHADGTRMEILNIAHEAPQKILKDFTRLIMPSHHDVQEKDVNLKRLGSVLWLTHDQQPADFEELLLLKGVGPRTLQSLALVSEVIHGTPSRFKDPARFSFAHGGKDGHPFPVPTKVYDETIHILQTSIEKAKIGDTDKQKAIKSLTLIAQGMEQNFEPDANSFDKVIAKEKYESYKYGGRTVFGKAKPPKNNNGQLSLF